MTAPVRMLQFKRVKHKGNIMKMDRVNIRQVTGHSQDELDAIALDALQASNPALGKKWKNLVEKAADREANIKKGIHPGQGNLF